MEKKTPVITHVLQLQHIMQRIARHLTTSDGSMSFIPIKNEIISNLPFLQLVQFPHGNNQLL